MISSALSILPRLLLATGWTCEPPTDNLPITERWSRGSDSFRAWATTESKYVGARQDEFAWIAQIQSDGLRITLLELGERIGLLRAADFAFDAAAEIDAFSGTTASVSTDPRAVRTLRIMGDQLVELAGINPAAWLATRKAAT